MFRNILLFFVCLLKGFSAFAIESTPLVIFLNGTSSAGKSSIAVKLQEQLKEPYLNTGLDHFVDILNPCFLMDGPNAELGYKFNYASDGQFPIVTITKGAIGQQLSYAMHRSMKTLIDHQFNLIIDEVLFCEVDFQDYLSVFQNDRVYFIAVKPPVEVAERREIARGDRALGLARGLYDSVYSNKIYDLEIDSSTMTPEDSAKAIISFIEGHPNPTAFKANNKH